MPDVLERVMVTDKCWIWLGGRSTKGYGQIVRDGKHLQVHRIAFESAYGDIPAGLVIDHNCHDPNICAGGTCVHRICVNPEHLDLATVSDNARRQTPAMKTECKHGHPLSGDNLAITPQGRRRCRTCHARTMKRYALNPNHEAGRARAWAIEQGYPVKARGRLSEAITEAYRAAQRMDVIGADAA